MQMKTLYIKQKKLFILREEKVKPETKIEFLKGFSPRFLPVETNDIKRHPRKIAYVLTPVFSCRPVETASAQRKHNVFFDYCK